MKTVPYIGYAPVLGYVFASWYVSPMCSPLDKVSAHQLFATTYALLLGIVLPFICWGTLATPGHPHQMPHFVFLMPVLRDGALPEAPLVHPTHAHEGIHSEDSPAPPPVGRSVPAQLSTAISLFNLFLVGQTFFLFYLIYTFSHVYLAPDRHLFHLRVITPPPRRLYL